MSIRGNCGDDNKASKCECGKPCQNYAHGDKRGCLKIHSCHRKICKFAQDIKLKTLEKDIEQTKERLEFEKKCLKDFDAQYIYRYVKTEHNEYLKKIKDLSNKLKKLSKKVTF